MLAILFTGCSSYNIIYQCELDKHTGNKLHYEDQLFSFDFIPGYNGIYFVIKNKTNQTAFLQWNKTYFAQPDGNTYHALNYDVVEISEKALNRLPNESIIPPDGIIARFTTSLNRMEVIDYSTIKSLNNHYGTIHRDRQTATIHSRNTELTKIKHESYVVIANYWPYCIKLEDQISNPENSKLQELSKFLSNNNEIKYGFSIKTAKDIKEYNFVLKITQADIVGIVTRDLYDTDGNVKRNVKGYTQTEELNMIIFSANQKDNWQWKKTDVEY